MYSRIYVEITNVCNKNCSFCHGTERKKSFLSKERFEVLLKKLKGFTEYIYFHVMGEPLLHPDLPYFIERATSNGFKCAVTTNGTLLKSRGEKLIASGVYKVSISLHSFEEGSEEEYASYIEECLSFADKSSANGVLTVLRLWNRGFDGGRNCDIEGKIRSYFEGEEFKEGSRGIRIRDKLHLEYGDRFKWPDLKEEEYGKEVFCYGLKDHFAVLTDGSVVPCCLDGEGVMTLGNVYESEVEEILNGERAVKIREGFKRRIGEEELCRKCGYATRFKKG